MKVPANYHLEYSVEDIQKSLKVLSSEISPWAEGVYQSTGQQVLAVCILRGAVLFFADLLRSIEVTIEPTFCRTWSYSSSNNEQQKGVRVSVEDVVAEGRSILMVDDICDTGSTLYKMQQVFKDLGAKEVKSCVLIHRLVSNAKFSPDWAAFRHKGDQWFVGYGMEDKNHYSNLSAVYSMK